eukprot:1142609-Pelagomonas_calceolata.AAC.7
MKLLHDVHAVGATPGRFSDGKPPGTLDNTWKQSDQVQVYPRLVKDEGKVHDGCKGASPGTSACCWRGLLVATYFCSQSTNITRMDFSAFLSRACLSTAGSKHYPYFAHLSLIPCLGAGGCCGRGRGHGGAQYRSGAGKEW